MKKKKTILLITFFVISGIIILRSLYETHYNATTPIATTNRSFEISDEENKIKMLFPDSCFKSINQTMISGIPCTITNYTCKPSPEEQMSLMIIKISKGANDTSIINVLHNYFPNIDSAQVFIAGKLEGLKYQSYSCGVPVENFIGMSNNKIYHYSETLIVDSLGGKKTYFGNLMIDTVGQNLKSLLSEIEENNEIKATQNNPLQAQLPNEELTGSVIETDKTSIIRINIPFKVYQTNPDTLLHFIKQHYYAMEHTFQKSIACDFKNGTTKENISYPNITYSVKLFEKSSDVNPWKTVIRSYTGNKERK